MDKVNKIPEKDLKRKKERLTFKFQTKFKNLDHPEWLTFYPKGSYFKLRYSPYSYFDPRPEISSNITSVLLIGIVLVSIISLTFTWFHLLLIPFLFLGWGDFYLRLPFNTGKTDEAENPDYGFYMYHIDPAPGKLNFPTCFIYQWNNYKSIEMPWSRTWVRTSILLKDNSWEHETIGNRKFFYKEEFKNKQYVVDYNFKDKSDNTIIPTKVYVQEREWRPIMFKWTKLFSKVSKTIDVHFSKEVGPRKGSWKGGTLGCGYNMKKGESAIQCMQRMERERKFR